jgi:predicted nucleotidyltransferase
MRPSEALDKNRDALRALVLRHRVRNPKVFGSAASGRDTEQSDLDLLVEPTVDTTLFDIGRICDEATRFLGVKVDVLTPDALPDHVRARVMSEAVPL